jgi:hypothetical protein
VDAATGRLSRGARCGFQQHVGIGVRCKKLPVRIAAGPAVRASPVTASEIEMNAAPMRGQFRSDLGTSANRDSGFGHDAHILCVDHYSRTKDRETPVVTTQDHLNSKTPYGATVRARWSPLPDMGAECTTRVRADRRFVDCCAAAGIHTFSQ